MGSVSVKITGLPDLQRAFKGLDDQVRAAAKPVVDAGAQKIAASWRAKVPVDTGEYRDSINVRTRKTKDGARSAIAARTDRPYPYMLERGTSKMAARPSAQPAYDEAREAAIDTVGEGLKQVLP